MDLDAVTSTMAIQHAENKLHMFQQIFRVLKPKDVFVLGDHVAGCSAIGQHLIGRERALVTLGRGEQVDDAQIRAQIQLDERKQEAEGNHCESVTQYQAYLFSCGLEDTECLWQDCWLAVMLARRPGQP